MRSTGMAYLLWSLCFFGFAGIHRFYLGKPLSGLIWFLTWGLFGIGQIVDLLLIPGMVEEKNFKLRARLSRTQYPQLPSGMTTVLSQSDTHLVLKLLSERPEATLADCVLATGQEPPKVKALLKQMQRDELIEVGNRERDGAVVYRMI